jgi:DNA-directed RNA polymerase specialized sigma24 family protein
LHPEWTDKLERIARTIVRKHRIRGDDADDLLQVIRIKFITKANSVPARGHVVWVRTTASNACIDFHRRLCPVVRDVADDDMAADIAPGLVDTFSQIPEETLASLLPAVLVASGENIRTVARWMGCSRKEAESWIARAMPRLRDAILEVNPALIVLSN